MGLQQGTSTGLGRGRQGTGPPSSSAAQGKHAALGDGDRWRRLGLPACGEYTLHSSHRLRSHAAVSVSRELGGNSCDRSGRAAEVPIRAAASRGPPALDYRCQQVPVGYRRCQTAAV